MRVMLCLLLLLPSLPLFAQSPSSPPPPPPGQGLDPFLPDSAPPPPAPRPVTPAPAPAAPPAPAADPNNAGSWDDYGKDDDDVIKPGKRSRSESAATGSLSWREVPWTIAAQAGGITFAFLVVWQLLAIPLGLIPCLGSIAGLVGVLLPVFAPFVGVAWATEYRGVRAPLIASLLSGLVWLLTGLACLPPVLVLSLTPLLPCAVISLFLVQSAAVSIASAVFLRRFGRLRVPGETPWKQLDWFSVPQPGADDIEKSGDDEKPKKKKS